ncbi:MAG: methyl-accepting chemotaxis protein [Myxococcaceae bacterium]
MKKKTPTRRRSSQSPLSLDVIGAHHLVARFDAAGAFVSGSPAFFAATGFSDSAPAASQLMGADGWKRVTEGQGAPAFFVGQQGQHVWLAGSASRLENKGKVQGYVVVASDIGQAHEQAVDAQGKLAAIDRVQATIEFSLDGKVLFANDNFCKTLGYAANEIVGQHHRLFCDPAYASSPEYAQFWQKLNRGEFEAGVFRRIGKGGKEVWIQASYNPVFDDSGKPVKVVKFATDVTERRNADAETAAKMAALDRVQAVIEFTPDGKVVHANENFLKTLGYALDEVKGQHHRIFCDPAYTASAEYGLFWQKLNRGEFEAGIFRRIGKGNKEVWIQASYNPVLDGNGKVTKVVKYAIDITDAQNRSSENAGKMAAIDRTQASIEFSLDGKVLWANDNFLKTLGYSLEDIKGQHHRIFCEPSYANSHDYVAFWQKLNRGEIDAGLYKRVGKGGKEVWIQAAYTPIADAAGRLSKVVKYATDVTATQQLVLSTQSVAQQAANGNLSARLSSTGLSGALKTLADSVNQLLDSVARPIVEVKAAAAAMAEGDLTRTMKGDYEGAFGELKDAFNASTDSLRNVITRTQTALAAMGAATTDIAQGNNNLSQRTQEQASALEETASSLEELTSTVKQNAGNATQANQLAASAKEAAEKGGAVVSAAVEAMRAVTDSSKKVGDIIGVIEQLAFQTNMLALNAAVEAARAGDQGRGFAVVAAEVRNLAQRSSGAAKEISELLKTSSERTAHGASLVNDSGNALKDIVLAVKKVSDIIGEISTASDEQASGIGQINQAVTSMDKMTQQNAALVEEAATAADSLSSQAKSVLETFAFFKVATDASPRNVFEPAFEVEKAQQQRAKPGAHHSKGLDWDAVQLAHSDWKNKLNRWLTTGASDFDPASAERSDACSLGRWLANEAPSPEVSALAEAHAAFHRMAGEVVATARKDKARALSLLNGDGFASATSLVIEALTAARRASTGSTRRAPAQPMTPPRGDDPNVWEQF